MREAAECYRQALRFHPDDPEAFYFLGCLAHETGNSAAACQLLRQATALAPREARYFGALGLALAATDEYEDAERSFACAIALHNQAEFHEGLGLLRKRQSRLSEAIQEYQEALRLDAGLVNTHYNLGNAYRTQGNTAEAIASFRRTLELAPNHAHALAALGQTARDPESLRRALDLLPGDAELACDLALVLSEAGQREEALAVYRRATEQQPDLALAWYGGGCVEMSKGEYVAAEEWFAKAVELAPDWLEARHNRARSLYELGLVSQAFTELARCAEMECQGSEQSRAMMAVIVPGVPEVDQSQILQTRKAWADRDLACVSAPALRLSGVTPLRIGYVSSFWNRDNWMKPVWGLINQHDRRVVQVNLFSDCSADKIKHGYRAHPDDLFFDTSKLSNAEFAELVSHAGIDVLIDLNGYSNMRRLPLFARRVAPVMVGWFNMYATTGICTFDCLIGDEQVVLACEDHCYSEKILRVSGSYLTFDVSYPVPPVSLRGRTGFMFGALASQYKITDEVIESWCRILLASPDSSLLIKNQSLEFHNGRQFLLRRFAKFGIPPQRLHLEGPEPHFEFLKAYDRIDVALDTFPYNGGTTTTEAIWQGVPVLAFYGDRWASRTSASILRAAGLGEFVAGDLDGYVRLGVELAGNAESPERLRELRQNMRERLKQSSVCDTRLFAREMEGHYRALATNPG